MNFKFIANPDNRSSTENITVINQFCSCIQLLKLSIVRSYKYTDIVTGTRHDILYIPLLFIWISTVLTCEYLGFVIMKIPSEIYNAILGRDQPNFKSVLKNGLLSIIGISILKSICEYLSCLFYCKTRYLLTGILLESPSELFIGTSYTMDNRDQRIGVDLDRYSELLSKLLPIIITCIVTIILYSILCFIEISWYTPIITFSHFLLFFVSINLFITMRYTKSVIYKEKQEGNFRYLLSMIRSCHEEILMIQNGASYFSLQAISLFDQLIASLSKISTWKGILEFVRALQAYSGSIITYISVGYLLLLSEKYKNLSSQEMASILSLHSAMTMSLIGKLSEIFTILPMLGEYFGHVVRIYPLFYQKRIAKDTDINQSCIHKDNNTFVTSFDHVTIETPEHRLLIHNLSFTLSLGENLLITGPSGSGKTSIIRVMLGLWDIDPKSVYFKYKTPNINVNNSTQVSSLDYIVVTSEPVLVKGSIFDQIMYPIMLPSASNESKREIIEALGMVGLQRLSTKTEQIFDASEWANMLSSGERQCIGLARIFYHHPKLAILDEATCALDESREQAICNNLDKLSDIQFIIISHKSTVWVKIHKTLKLHSDDRYDISISTFSNHNCLFNDQSFI